MVLLSELSGRSFRGMGPCYCKVHLRSSPLQSGGCAAEGRACGGHIVHKDSPLSGELSAAGSKGVRRHVSPLRFRQGGLGASLLLPEEPVDDGEVPFPGNSRGEGGGLVVDPRTSPMERDRNEAVRFRRRKETAEGSAHHEGKGAVSAVLHLEGELSKKPLVGASRPELHRTEVFGQRRGQKGQKALQAGRYAQSAAEGTCGGPEEMARKGQKGFRNTQLDVGEASWLLPWEQTREERERSSAHSCR